MRGVLHLIEEDLQEWWIDHTIALREQYLAKWAELERRFGP